jgi:hypothetical protein
VHALFNKQDSFLDQPGVLQPRLGQHGMEIAACRCEMDGESQNCALEGAGGVSDDGAFETAIMLGYRQMSDLHPI